MRKKRGTDHCWHLVKYRGDAAIYAKCKCGHFYNCGRDSKNEDGSWSFIQIPTIFYPYCPCCGVRKKQHSTEIEKIGIYSFDEKKHGLIYDMSGFFLK